MASGRRGTRAHRAVAVLGWVLAAVGAVGLIVYRDPVVLWVFMIAFGVAAVPRVLLERLRDRRRS